MLQFADLINRYDFIDNIVEGADPYRFEMGVCVGSDESNIAAPVYSPRTPRWTLGGIRRRRIPLMATRLARILQEWKADILHTHHYDEAVIGMLATRLCSRTRLVVGRHYSDAIYRSSRGWRKRILLRVEQAVNRHATRIVVPSSQIAELLTKRQGVPADKIDLIPYGFASQKYTVPAIEDVRRLRESLGLDGAFVLGNFSRLHEEKGQRYLVEAMAQLRPRYPHLRLLIVGEGAERADLERRIEFARLKDVVLLLGWRRDAMTLMAAVDAVVQPTLQEAFSQVMAEALWMGKPLVITDVSGATDVVQDGDNGLIVLKGDVTSLVASISRLVESPSLCESLGESGRSFVDQNLDVERIIPLYELCYLKAIGSDRSTLQ